MNMASTDGNLLSSAALLRVLDGVAAVTKATPEEIEPLSHWISTCNASRPDQDESLKKRSEALFSYWCVALSSKILDGANLRQLAGLVLGIASLRQTSRDERHDILGGPHRVWRLIHDALTSPDVSRPLFTAPRSAQGFLSVTLCNLITEGKMDELFCLNIWLPDDKRGNPDFTIYSNQAYAWSWVLAGKAQNHAYEAQPATELEGATHAEYVLVRGSEQAADTTHQTHQPFSRVENTDRLVRASASASVTHTLNMTYAIRAGALHKTEVEPDGVHATLCYFDAQKGYVADATVLGPKDDSSFKQLHGPADVTVELLAKVVEGIQSWEGYMRCGGTYLHEARGEYAYQSFNRACLVREPIGSFYTFIQYKLRALCELGCTYRRFGKYDQARVILEGALAIPSTCTPSRERIKWKGELAVVYRHMNRLTDAKHIFQDQYHVAIQCDFGDVACRAVGNLGIVNYQLYLQTKDDTLLDLAVDQLKERVERARKALKHAESQNIDTNIKARRITRATTWECVGLSRLSLCYAASGNIADAVSSARNALSPRYSLNDPDVIALSRFFTDALFC